MHWLLEEPLIFLFAIRAFCRNYGGYFVRVPNQECSLLDHIYVPSKYIKIKCYQML